MTLAEGETTILVGVVALAFSLVTVPLARWGACRYGITDQPIHGKKFHSTATPYLGGLAIVIAVVGASAIRGWQGEAWALLGSAFLVSSIGLLDDIRTIKPIFRLLVECAAALMVFFAGAHVHLFGEVPDALLTVIWLVGITNAYNLLDNMDACASSIVVASAFALLAAAILQGEVLVATLAIALGAAALGFLVYNWHPARIFLGDAGSLFLGFLLSATALKLKFPVGHSASISAVALIALPAVFDTTLVVSSRLRAHRAVYIGGIDHVSHRLVHLGISKRLVPILFTGAAGLCGGLGVVVGRGLINIWFVLPPVGLVCVFLLLSLLKVPIYSSPEISFDQPNTTLLTVIHDTVTT